MSSEKFDTVLVNADCTEVFVLSLTNDQVRLMDWLDRKGMLDENFLWKGKVTETVEI